MDTLQTVFASQDKQHLEHTTKLLIDALHTYFDSYPVFNPVRFPATALTSVCENPYLPVSILEQIVRVPVWIFTIDAVIDEQQFTEAVVRERIAVYEQIARGATDIDVTADPYAYILADIRRGLTARPAFESLRPLWEDCYIRMMDGMMFEAYDHPLRPTWDEYLNHGLYSIGLPLYVVSTWILQLEAGAKPDFTRLIDMMKLSGICIRLANDLRTYEKEKREGNLNAIMIKEQELIAGGADLQTATRAAFSCVQSELNRYMQVFESMRDEQDVLNVALCRLTAFSVGFYHQSDFHQVARDQIATLLEH